MVFEQNFLDKRKKVEAQTAAVTDKVRPVKKPFFRFAENRINFKNEAVHIEIRFVNVVEKVFAGAEIQRKLKEGGRIFDVGHRFFVFSVSDHRKFSPGNSLHQNIHITLILFAENSSRADDCQAVFAVPSQPFSVFFLGLPFGAAVIVKIMDFAGFGRPRRRKTVNGHRRGEDDFFNAEVGARVGFRRR